MGNIKDALEGIDITTQVQAEKDHADQVSHAVARFSRQHKWALVLDHPASVALMNRMDRAQGLAGQVALVGCDYYQVQSQTHPGHYYNVGLDKGCTCPDAIDAPGKAPFGWCKHRLAAWLYRERTLAEMDEIMRDDTDPHEDLQDLLDNLHAQARALNQMVQDLTQQAAKAQREYAAQRNGSQPKS